MDINPWLDAGFKKDHGYLSQHERNVLTVFKTTGYIYKPYICYIRH